MTQQHKVHIVAESSIKYNYLKNIFNLLIGNCFLSQMNCQMNLGHSRSLLVTGIYYICQLPEHSLTHSGILTHKTKRF